MHVNYLVIHILNFYGKSIILAIRDFILLIIVLLMGFILYHCPLDLHLYLYPSLTYVQHFQVDLGFQILQQMLTNQYLVPENLRLPLKDSQY